MQWLVYIKLVRPVNLIITSVLLLLIYFSVLDTVSVEAPSNNSLLWLLILNTTVIMAGGNVVNDIYDSACDRHNKPDKWLVDRVISGETARSYYQYLLVAGGVLTIWIYFITWNLVLLAIFLMSALLLYLYSRIFKRVLLLGNLIISFLCTLTLWVLPIAFSSGSTVGASFEQKELELMWLLSFFAFGLTFIREVVKDFEDKSGDQLAGIRTIAHHFSTTEGKYLLSFLALFPLLGIVYAMTFRSHYFDTFQMICLSSLMASGLFLFFKISTIKIQSDFSQVSFLLKIYMVQGLILLIV